MADLLMRAATHEDAGRISEIYNHYVLHSTITFDTETPTEEDRRVWLEEHDASHPVLVGEIDGAVVAWGSLTKWGARPAYRHTVEVSVYVDKDSRGRGVGEGMTVALLAEAERLGHHAVVGQIEAGNAASLKLSERLGFERVGLLRQVGRKFDRWLDVVITELLLVGPYDRRH